MEGEHLGLNHQPRLLVAKQLRDQRQIEPIARAGRSVSDLGYQFVA